MGEDGGRSGAALLYEPASELRIAEDWYRRKALADLLQLEYEQQVNKDRLYRALDHLLLHKAALEPAPDLAPARRTHAGSYPRLLSRFVLSKSLKMWQSRAGLGNSPRTVFKALARIQSHDATASASSFQSACASPKDELPAVAASDRSSTTRPKCSADFSAKSLKRPQSMVDSA
jgi:hypothetical protein